MEEKEIEKLVEREVLKAKVITQDKTIRFLLWFFGILLTVFGVLIPLWWSNRSSDKVDEAISNMKTDMRTIITDQDSTISRSLRGASQQQRTAISTISKDADKILKDTKEQVQALVGKQLSRPELTVAKSGEEINGKTIKFDESPKSEEWGRINVNLYNKGDAPANHVNFLIYLKENPCIDLSEASGEWIKRNSDESEYAVCYQFANSIGGLDAKLFQPIEFFFYIQREKKRKIEPAMLKIYYEQPEPTRIKFNINP